MRGLIILWFIILLMGFTVGCATKGDDGVRGFTGADGESCYVEQNNEGVYISCPDSDAFLYYSYSGEEQPDHVYCKRDKKKHKRHKLDKHEKCTDESDTDFQD